MRPEREELRDALAALLGVVEFVRDTKSTDNLSYIQLTLRSSPQIAQAYEALGLDTEHQQRTARMRGIRYDRKICS